MIKTAYLIVDDVAGDSAEIFLANNDVQALNWFKNTCQKVSVDGTKLTLFKTMFVDVDGDGTKRADVKITNHLKMLSRYPQILEQKLEKELEQEVKK